jgi:hypothetical protein
VPLVTGPLVLGEDNLSSPEPPIFTEFDPVLDTDTPFSTEPAIFTAFDPAEALSAAAFADEFHLWGDIFSFPTLPILPATLYAEAAHCTSFTSLLAHAAEAVRQAHDYDACRAYAASQIEITGGINVSLATQHLQWMQDIGVVATCARVQEQHAGSYLQPHIVRALYPGFPEYETLLRIAVEGSPVLRPPLWTPNNGVGVQVRAIATSMADAFILRMTEEQAKGDVIIVEAEPFTALCSAQGVAFNLVECGWVFKHGSKESDLLGRITDDHTHSPCPLNTIESKALADDLYGPPVCPQLTDMCESLRAAQTQYPDQPIYGMAEDVSRAYRRCRFRPDDCPLAGAILPLTRDGKQYYALRMSHSFGDNTSAHVWGVPARALVWLVNQSVDLPGIAARSDIYVDDYYAFTPQHLIAPTSRVFDLACSVAGDDARDASKSRSSRELQLLGWQFLDEFNIVRPNTKGWFSLLALFFHNIPWNITKKCKLPVRMLQRLGSYASRYSQAFPALRPYCHGFYGDTRGARSFATRRISTRTAQDVWMWRMFLAIAYHHPHAMATPLHWPTLSHADPDVQAAAADLIVYVDAALSNNSCGAYIEDISWCFFTCPVVSFMHGDHQFPMNINILECIGLILGILLAIDTAPPTCTHIHVWCDNAATVAWAATHRVHSPLTCLLLQILTLAAAAKRILITVGWLPGVRNVIADAISRAFKVPHGDVIRQELDSSLSQQFLPPEEFSAILSLASATRLSGALTLLPEVRTLLRGSVFCASPKSMGSTPLLPTV